MHMFEKAYLWLVSNTKKDKYGRLEEQHCNLLVLWNQKYTPLVLTAVIST